MACVHCGTVAKATLSPIIHRGKQQIQAPLSVVRNEGDCQRGREENYVIDQHETRPGLEPQWFPVRFGGVLWGLSPGHEGERKKKKKKRARRHLPPLPLRWEEGDITGWRSEITGCDYDYLGQRFESHLSGKVKQVVLYFHLIIFGVVEWKAIERALFSCASHAENRNKHHIFI